MKSISHWSSPPVPLSLRERGNGARQLAFWRDYAITMRRHLLFVSGITGIVGLALAPPVPLYLVLPAMVVFFLSYGFGQALTDCFQLDTDRLSAPERPLVQGKIRRRDTMFVSLVGLFACGATLAVYHVTTLPLAALSIFGLASYTWFKRRWWGGPFYNAWIVTVLGVIAYLSGIGAAGAVVTWSPSAAATLATVFFGYANFVLAGYHKDVSADRATGYRTFPVVFGLRRSAVMSHALALLALGSGAGAVVTLPGLAPTPAWIAFLTGALFATLLGQIRLHALVDERSAHRAIVPVVHAYVLLLAAVAVAQRPSWTAPLVLFYAAFAYAMARRPSRHQV